MRWVLVMVMLSGCGASSAPTDAGPVVCGTMTCGSGQICYQSEGGVDAGMPTPLRCVDVPSDCPPLHDCAESECAAFTCFANAPLYCDTLAMHISQGGRRLDCAFP